ncbi:LytTR family DNA-binding domain-containing protein [Aliiroseovarius marinus]|uniref:LytTR family DNA-binding domain-containing protein n=1 Tax=Aliiroseovarius marinus TaxID=2500159 RepID=UPI002493F57A|nr:LytTR family DNA-binding domain-containing protein [Aliiroseovarius marinus]
MRPPANTARWNEMHVIAINGTRVRCDWGVLHRLLVSGRMNGTFVLVALALATFKSTLFEIPAPYLTRILFWVIGVYLTVVFWYSMVRVIHLILGRLQANIAVINYPVTAAATIGAVFVSTFLINLLTQSTFLYENLTWVDFSRNLLIAALVELLTVTSILPFFWEGTPPEPGRIETSTQASQPDTIRFEDKDIHLPSLLHVQSQEHYLEFVFDQTKFLLRGALKDFVALCDHSHGIQCHRSHWVAKKAVTGRKRQDGNPVLLLSNATAVPIARGRLSDVKTWLEQHRPEI